MVPQTESEVSRSDVSRLDRLEQRARTYFHIGRAKSSLSRLVRATRLETAANARMIKIITAEIEAHAYLTAPAQRSSL